MSADWKSYSQKLAVPAGILLASYFGILQFSLELRTASVASISGDEKSFFLNLAVIGGTLLALSFVTLNFFLENQIKRFESTALPVFHSSDFGRGARPHVRLKAPHSLTDVKLFDGDPLVIFLAFSVAVTWIQFLIPLTLGLTAAWLGANLRVLADELLLLVVCFTFSYWTRIGAINRLQPYFTRDEQLWPVLGIILSALYFVPVAIGLVYTFSSAYPAARNVTIWDHEILTSRVVSNFIIRMAQGVTSRYPKIFTYDNSIIALYVVSILSLLIGTYITNKDMFIFFKSIAVERMRLCWLDTFVRERYPELSVKINTARSAFPPTAMNDLLREWNDGYPPLRSTHKEFTKMRQEHLREVWRDFIDRRGGVAIWLLDVPIIANWEKEVENLLEGKAPATIAAPAKGWVVVMVRGLTRGISKAANRTGMVIARAKVAVQKGNLRARAWDRMMRICGKNRFDPSRVVFILIVFFSSVSVYSVLVILRFMHYRIPLALLVGVLVVTLAAYLYMVLISLLPFFLVHGGDFSAPHKLGGSVSVCAAPPLLVAVGLLIYFVFAR